jgi:hypothetical protein
VLSLLPGPVSLADCDAARFNLSEICKAYLHFRENGATLIKRNVRPRLLA